MSLASLRFVLDYGWLFDAFMRGWRVLVCDDERHIVRLIQVNLERHGYLVTCGFDGREAIELLSGAVPGMEMKVVVMLEGSAGELCFVKPFIPLELVQGFLR